MQRIKKALSVRVSLDCIIYEDGAIWGPDTLKYYLMLLTRRSVFEELSAEFKDAQIAGEDFKTHLERIRSEVSQSRSKRSSIRRDYIRMLAKTPTPEALFRKLDSKTLLPEFHHVGGENQ
jgi:hypothetical protein